MTTTYRYGDPVTLYGVARYGIASPPAPPRRRMSKVAAKLTNLSVNDKIAKGRTGLTAAATPEGVLVLGNPAPAEVAGLQTATDDLETARDAKLTADNAAKTATQAQDTAELAFNDAYAAYCRIGQTKSGGDAVKIGQIGLDVAGAPAPIGEMPAPLNLVATMGDHAGEVDLMCEPVRGAATMIWQYCADPMSEGNWQNGGVTTKSSNTIGGLTSGTKYWFRCAAIGTAGQGPWSDPAQKMAP